MRVIDNKILVKEVKAEESALKEKIGNMEYFVGSGSSSDYTRAKVLNVAKGVEGVSEGDEVFIYPNAGKRVVDPVTKDSVTVITVNEIISVL